MIDRFFKFLKKHGQIAFGVLIGCLISLIISITTMNSDAQIKAAFISGSFNLLAAVIAIFVGYISYRAAHVPFKEEQRQLVSLLHANLKSIHGHIEVQMKIRAMIPATDISSKVSNAMLISQIKLLVDEKSFSKLPGNLMEELIELAAEMSYSNAKTEWLKGEISDKVFNSIDLSHHEEVNVDGVFESAVRIRSYALSLMKKIENIN